MIIARELLFGQLAVARGFITQEQLEECLEYQRTEADRVSIGKILLRRAYITEDEIGRVLEIQEHNLKEASGYTPRKKLKDTFFGTLAVMKKFTTLPRVVECLREQERLERFNIFLRLGEIFVSKGYMDIPQVRDILEEQKTRPVVCAKCGRTADIVAPPEGDTYLCAKCGNDPQSGNDFTFKKA